MPKYLLLFKYSAEGSKGFLKERAAPREAEIRKTFAGGSRDAGSHPISISLAA